jgi:hypothetical protein
MSPVRVVMGFDLRPDLLSKSRSRSLMPIAVRRFQLGVYLAVGRRRLEGV